MNILVVDGNSILNRAFYGIRPLTTKSGQPTNAIYGFLTMLEKIKSDTNPDRVAIAFDLKAKTFRHKAYEGYKSNRKGMPEELAAQLEPLKTLLTLLGYTLVTCEGFEGDDILGTLSLEAEKQGHKCFIATGDRDSLQLVSENTTVDLASNKSNILYKYMIPPETAPIIIAITLKIDTYVPSGIPSRNLIISSVVIIPPK